MPKTIHYFLDAGIKVWVLTGDKMGTAIAIGKTAELIPKTASINEVGIDSFFSSLCLPSTVCLSQPTLLLLQVASLRSKVDPAEVEREDREVKAKLAKAAGAEKAARSEAAKAKKEMEAQKELVGKCTALEETCKTLTLQVRKSAVFCLFACLN